MGHSYSYPREHPFVGYGQSREEAAGYLTLVLRFHGHKPVFCSKEGHYYVWHDGEKLYLIFHLERGVYQCHVPL